MLRISVLKEETASFAAFSVATSLLAVIEELENCSLNSLSFQLAAWQSLEAWARLHEAVSSSEYCGSLSCDRCETAGFQFGISKVNLNAKRKLSELWNKQNQQWQENDKLRPSNQEH